MYQALEMPGTILLLENLPLPYRMITFCPMVAFISDMTVFVAS